MARSAVCSALALVALGRHAGLMPDESATPTVRVVKRKWDRTVSTMDIAHPPPFPATRRPGSFLSAAVGSALAGARSTSLAATSLGRGSRRVVGPLRIPGRDPVPERLQGPRIGSLRDTAHRLRDHVGRPRPGLRGHRQRTRAPGRGRVPRPRAHHGLPRSTSGGAPGRASPRSLRGTSTAIGRSTDRCRIGWRMRIGLRSGNRARHSDTVTSRWREGSASVGLAAFFLARLREEEDRVDLSGRKTPISAGSLSACSSTAPNGESRSRGTRGGAQPGLGSMRCSASALSAR